MSDDDLDDDLNLDESFDDFEQKEKTLGDLWRDNAAVKVGIVVVAALGLFFIFSFFGKAEKPLHQSYVDQAPDISSAPGTQEASPAYIQAIEEQNEADIERAFAEGDSALPVPIDPPVGQISVPEQEKEAEDPLQRWRRLQEERLQREIQQREVESDAPEINQANTQKSEAVKVLVKSMQKQMSSILERQSTLKLSSTKMTDSDFLEKLRESREGGDEDFEDDEFEDEDSENTLGKLLMPAGKIVYAQTLLEANTDTPGPLMAEIMSGPLKGSRILGTFEEENEYLILTFDTVIYNDESLSISAVALDPETTLTAVVTEVDHRYFQRAILPAAAAFVEGVANVLAERSSTIFVSDGGTVVETTEEADLGEAIADGIGEAGTELRTVIDEMADDVEVLVKVHAGTPIGILFLEPVRENTSDDDDDDFEFDEE